jgi:membrane protein required for colicin V production
MDIPLSHFNFFDVFLLVVLFFSMIIGFARGFVKEVLSVISWATAVWVGTQNFDWPKDLLRQISLFQKDLFLLEMGGCAISFFVTLFGLLIISQIISSWIQDTVAQSINRSLGLFFGFVRGIALICLGYLASLFFIKADHHPIIVRSSKSVVLLEKSALILEQWLPESLKNAAYFKEHLDNILKSKLSSSELVNQLSSPD